MLPPKSGVRPLIDEIVGGLYEAETVLDELERLRRADGPQEDVAAVLREPENSHERRRAKEAQLLWLVHSALWRSPWLAARGPSASSRSATEEVIFSANLPAEGRSGFTLVADSRVARRESQRDEIRPRDTEGVDDDRLHG